MFMTIKKNHEKYIMCDHLNNQIKSQELTYKTEELLYASDNRFKITVKVAERAKRRKYEDLDIIEDPLIKPVIRAILEMVDEITQPEIIAE